MKAAFFLTSGEAVNCSLTPSVDNLSELQTELDESEKAADFVERDSWPSGSRQAVQLIEQICDLSEDFTNGFAEILEHIFERGRKYGAKEESKRWIESEQNEAK